MKNKAPKVTKPEAAREDARPTTEDAAPPPLAALPALEGQKVQSVLVSVIEPSPFQPRSEFPEEEMAVLRQNIADHGIRIPLLGRPKPGDQDRIELVAGERRWRCAQALQLESVPMLVQDLSDAEVLRIQRVENAGRENLKALEAAADYVRLEEAGQSVADICRLHGVQRSHVYMRKRVARLPEAVLQLVRDGKLAITIADEIAKLPTAELQTEAATRIAEEKHYDWEDGERITLPISVREARQLLRDEFQADLTKAPFDLDAEYVIPTDEDKNAAPAPACTVCPQRSGNIPGHEGNPNVCTRLTCFHAKRTAHAEAALAQAKADGKRIIAADKFASKSYSYKMADDTCYQDNKGRSFATLAKTAAIKPSVTVNRDGQVVEVFTPDDQRKILAAHKLDRDEETSQNRAAEKAKRDEEKKAIADAINQASFTASTLAPAELYRKLALTVMRANEWSLPGSAWMGRSLPLTGNHDEDFATLGRYIQNQESWENLLGFCVQVLLNESVGTSDPSALSIWEINWRDFLPGAKPAKATPAKLAAKPNKTKPAKASKRPKQTKATKPSKKGKSK